MKLIIDGEYDKDLIKLIGKQNLPISQVIVYFPKNPLKNK